AVLEPGEGQPRVATVDGAVVGFILYFPPGRSDGVLFPEAWASVRLLGVAPAMRGHGLGKALLQDCLRRARAEG
ncbi:GNAT family N-acetyltransferase, partial [Acinetobacter baumannii]|uniref:GNAT family N-acetyltransferase n=1 Tax=Acinetobacter baumannii TaxID=470 RepID=UPI0013D1A895